VGVLERVIGGVVGHHARAFVTFEGTFYGSQKISQNA